MRGHDSYLGAHAHAFDRANAPAFLQSRTWFAQVFMPNAFSHSTKVLRDKR